MAEIKWIKITTNMFDDEKIKLIDAMPERDTIHYVWIRLLVQAGKTNANGYIFLNENVPYTDEMLSTIFNRPLNSIRLALKTLSNFGMIDINEDKLIKITNWEKHQNIEGMEKIKEQNRLRKQKQREKEKQACLLKASPQKDVSRDMSRDITQQNKNKNKKEERDIDKELLPESKVENDTCPDSSIKDTSKIEVNNSSSKGNMEVFKHFEKCGFGLLSPVMIEKIAADIEVYSKHWVIRAVEVADEAGKHNYNYVKGILENWKANGGIKDRKEVKVDGYGSNFKKDTGEDKNKWQGYRAPTPKVTGKIDTTGLI